MASLAIAILERFSDKERPRFCQGVRGWDSIDVVRKKSLCDVGREVRTFRQQKHMCLSPFHPIIARLLLVLCASVHVLTQLALLCL